METERIVFKTIDYCDRDILYFILTDERVIPYLNMSKPSSIEDIDMLIAKYKDHINKGDFEGFSMFEKKSGAFIGVWLFKLDLYNDDAYESTLYLHPDYQNKGYGKETLTFMTDYFFKNYKITNLRSYIKERNAASAAVLNRCGYQLEKIFDVEGIKGKIHSYLTKENNII